MKLHLIDGTTYECKVGGSLLGHQAVSVELDYDDFVELAGGGQSAARRADNQAWFFEHVSLKLVPPEGVRARQAGFKTREFVKDVLRILNGREPDKELLLAVAEKVEQALPRNNE